MNIILNIIKKTVLHIIKAIRGFAAGVILGHAYYYFLLTKIPFPQYIANALSISISLILGIGNVICTQLRCISLLVLPMYCGKPGRGVLKALVLSHIIAGPITNMGLNAKEVVRVFACTTRLSYNLSREEYELMMAPVKTTALHLTEKVEEVKKTFRSIEDIIEPIELEIENIQEMKRIENENNFVAGLYLSTWSPKCTNVNLRSIDKWDPMSDNFRNLSNHYEYLYKCKLHYRCENQIYEAISVCIQRFTHAYIDCSDLLPNISHSIVCWPLKLIDMCNLTKLFKSDSEICDVGDQVSPGLGVAYLAIKSIKWQFCKLPITIHLEYNATDRKLPSWVQDAEETAKRVQDAFEEKTIVMSYVRIAMNVFIAILFLKIFFAAVIYHDSYLTIIDYDNVYLTRYFKRLDVKRKLKGKPALLPLKKMERNRYIDIHSLSSQCSRQKLITQVLKVMLEVVTATTFVMLDRLFYEALDVVRQHAEKDTVQQGTRDLEINVEGTGIMATAIRLLLQNIVSRHSVPQVTNACCLPRPRLMPYIYFFKIYGGYLWILLLLFINPYTARLKRCICSQFYPGREKQRILHLYNDILKKRMKMDKTLRRKAIQSVRAHYLSGETLLSMRMKFPQLLGWLHILPAARMTCLICDEVEPRDHKTSSSSWYSCFTSKCPFVFCEECWHEAGEQCLACDPCLAELSDIDSISEEERGFK